MVTSLEQLYVQTRDQLAPSEGKNAAGTIARDLICTFSGQTIETFLQNYSHPANSELVASVQDGVQRYLLGEPLAYILGEWEFYGIPLYVTKDVLIPRDDTCAVAELAINQSLFLSQGPRILDLCCGSGCIGLAIASRVKDAKITLADISKDALQIAKKNIARNKLGGRVSCFATDARCKAPGFLGKFDLIVSNPPYISEMEMKDLPHSVADYEPLLALYGGIDGLDFYRDIVRNFSDALKPGGYLCFEFGMGQGDDVCRILEENGYSILERKKDMNKRERAVLAKYCVKGY